MGLCKTSNCEQGKILPGNRFTLHGVWPVQADGSDLSYCQGKDKFSYSALKKMPLMTSVWPSFQINEKDFWRHQWEKHGTCAELDFSDYFQRSLNLGSRYNSLLFKALAQNNISPSPVIDMHTAPLATQYYKAIVTSLKLVPRIKCTTAPGSNVYLLEIHLCAEFDLNKVKNCSEPFYFGCGSRSQYQTNRALYYLDPKKV